QNGSVRSLTLTGSYRANSRALGSSKPSGLEQSWALVLAWLFLKHYKHLGCLAFYSEKKVRLPDNRSEGNTSNPSGGQIFNKASLSLIKPATYRSKVWLEVPLSPELASLCDGDKKWDLLYKSLTPDAFTRRTVIFMLGDSSSSALVSHVALTSLRNLKLTWKKIKQHIDG
ncbi:hypothetical protein DV515_00006584, partial [Chloebia gouldiae]